jgi:hypothetical protein
MPFPPLFTDSFQSIVHILDSDIFLTLLRACLCRSIDPKAQLWSDAILNRVNKTIFKRVKSNVFVLIGITFNNVSILRTRTCI